MRCKVMATLKLEHPRAQAYKKANRSDLSLMMIEKLTQQSK